MMVEGEWGKVGGRSGSCWHSSLQMTHITVHQATDDLCEAAGGEV